MNIENFLINDYSIDIKDEVLIVSNKNGVIKDDVSYIKEILEESTGKVYNYIMYKDSLGYYHAYDFILNKSIYCATLNRTHARELVNKYIKEINK